MIRKTGHLDLPGDRLSVENAIERELYRFGLDLVAASEEYFSEKGISDTSTLRNSIISEVERVKNGLRLQFGTNVKYAIYVHEGTKPHFIGKETEAGVAIRKWVVRKLGIKGDKNITRTAFFVRRKIGKEGTEARPFLKVAMDSHINKLAARIGTAIDGATV